MAQPVLITAAGTYDKAAIMRMALSQCCAWSTIAVQVGPSALDLEFRTVRVFERRMLSVALKTAWRAARLQRLDWRCAQPGARAAAFADEAARNARHATEAAIARRQIAEMVLNGKQLPNTSTPAAQLAA